uniref:Glutathione peroxidase n=1 Tax=Gouania willdenowi TaxID=441366 RepID=A0A8C5NFG0_GOUWI
MNALMEMFGGLNFTVLGFCCNQFGLQSPEVNHETLNILKHVRPGGGFVPKLWQLLVIRKFYWSPIKVNDIRWNFEKTVERDIAGLL